MAVYQDDSLVFVQRQLEFELIMYHALACTQVCRFNNIFKLRLEFLIKDN